VGTDTADWAWRSPPALPAGMLAISSDTIAPAPMVALPCALPGGDNLPLDEHVGLWRIDQVGAMTEAAVETPAPWEAKGKERPGKSPAWA